MAKTNPHQMSKIAIAIYFVNFIFPKWQHGDPLGLFLLANSFLLVASFAFTASAKVLHITLSSEISLLTSSQPPVSFWYFAAFQGKERVD